MSNCKECNEDFKWTDNVIEDYKERQSIVDELLSQIRTMANTPFSDPQKQRLEIVKLVDRYRGEF